MIGSEEFIQVGIRIFSSDVLSLGSDEIALHTCFLTITTCVCCSSAASSPSGAIGVLQLSDIAVLGESHRYKIMSDGSG